jgi:acyl-CoA synthetase (AMP-forming)/AMP-acid ligase II
MTAVAATIAEVLAGHTRERPGETLYIAPETGQTLTYAGLARNAGRLAGFLAARGILPPSTIALFMHNGLDMASLYLGLMANGYTVAPLNLLSHGVQLASVVAHSEARLIFASASYAGQLESALAGADSRPPIVVLGQGIDGALADQKPPPRAGDVFQPRPSDTALLMYTSGTTGEPKGVMLSHANLLAGARAVAGWHGLGPRDRVLSPLPLYHINGQVIGTLAPFVSGGSIVAPERFSASQWWDTAVTHRCTWINMVPAIIAYLLNTPETRRFPFIRFGRSASAPLPPAHHRTFEERFGIPVIEAMGMTECASTVFCNPHDGRRQYGSPGFPCGVEAGVIDAHGRHLAAGETGELVLRGANVMAGYFKAPEMTAGAIGRDGWLRTGDLGYRDAGGFYYVTGRLKELIIKGGENIAPREIDEALLRHPDVLEAAAFGIADPNLGQDIAVALIMKPGVTFDEAALRAFAEVELGPYKTPRRWYAVKELPKGPSGKVQRLKLPGVLGGWTDVS